MRYPRKLWISMRRIHSRNNEDKEMGKVEATVGHAEMLLFWTELLMNFSDWDLTCLQKQGINATAGSMIKTLGNSPDNTAELNSRKTSSKHVLT